LFAPRSVAIIGASTNPNKIGGRPIHFMQRAGFRGAIHPINIGAAEVQGLRAYATLEAVPGDIDSAIIAVPAAALTTADAASPARGAKAAVIFSAGFAELGATGRAAQDAMVEVARRHGMRLLGPNCLGVASIPDGYFGVFGVGFDKLQPRAGHVSIAAQSGLFGTYLAALGDEAGLGYARFVTTGNEADVDVAEAIDFLADDPLTRVILASMEGCGDGRRLRRALVRAAHAGKRVIFMKIGTTEVGAAAAAAHTGSLAGSDVIYGAVLRECGAYRAQTIEEMLDVAAAAARRPSLARATLGVVTVSGGVGILTADAALEAGLGMPQLSAERLAGIRAAVPYSVGNNPLDTTAQFINDIPVFARCLEELLADGQFGALIALLGHTGVVPEQFAQMREPLLAACRAHPDVLTAVAMRATPDVRRELEAAGLLVMPDPSRAVRTIAALARFGRFDPALLPDGPSMAPRARLPDGPLSESVAKALLADAGIPVLGERRAADAEAAVGAAEALGFPVVLKIDAPSITHKTEVGGVALDLRTPDDVRETFTAMVTRVRAQAPDAPIDGVLVAPMARGGIEVILGVTMDPTFGPMAMFGLGGVGVDLYKDVVFASAPLTPARAEALLDTIRGRALLGAWRGRPPVDRAAIVDALCRLAAFACAHEHEIASVEINPFRVDHAGGLALDALIVRR